MYVDAASPIATLLACLIDTDILSSVAELWELSPKVKKM